MSDTPTDHRTGNPRGFFGRRVGRGLREAHARLVDQMLPALALDLDRPAPASLAGLFPLPVEAVRLEIGFGAGENLISQALARPQTGFIGCEAFVNGMAKALREIAQHRLANVRLHFGDALPLLQWLPPAGLAGIDLLYPDPWPKRRHWKRRFVQTTTVADIARALKEGGEFRFATDIPDYAAWALARLMRCDALEWTAKQASDWHSPWPGFQGTRYEAKARREGRRSCYLVFRRKPVAAAGFETLRSVLSGPVASLPEAQHALRRGE